MNSEIIERALHLSDNNEYVAVERLSNGDFDSPYGDLLWVRGTNTSIFLSCYYENEQWKLMAKGTQFRKGFVPMMETIDGGINAIFGVNYTMISGYPPSAIAGSGGYATKPHNIIPFDIELAEQELRDIISGKKRRRDCSPILMAYRFLRIRQYRGSNRPDLGEVDMKDTECYTEIKQELATNRLYYQKVIAFMADSFDRYRNTAIQIKESELDYPEKTEKYLALENKARAEYDLPLAYFAPADLYTYDVTQKSDREMRELFQAPFINKDKTLFSSVFAVAMFATGNKLDKFVEIMTNFQQKAQIALERYDFQEMLFETAIDITRPPAFELTNIDKEILKFPIPIVVASTTRRGMKSKFSTGEENIIDSIAMGQDHGQVDVIYVRSQDVNALREVLSMIHPPLYMKIRVDDTIF